MKAQSTRTIFTSKMISEENFEIICRICLLKCTIMKHISHIDTRSPGKLTVIELLKHCASVQVEEGDGLPQQVCVKCILHMRRCLLLGQVVINSDATLRSVLKSKSKQPDIETIFLDCPSDCYKIEEEIIATNTETQTMEQNNLMFASSYLNNIDNIEHVDVTPEDTNFDINFGVDETDSELPVDHSYFSNDIAETNKEEKMLYYCMYCTSVFNDNQKFHLHFSEEHPKAYSYTVLENLLQSGKLQLQTEKLLEETTLRDAKMNKESLNRNPKDDSHVGTENSESAHPQLKRPQKRKSKLIENSSSGHAKKAKKNLEKYANDAPKTKDNNQETENSGAPDIDDKTCKQPLPQLKKLINLKSKSCNICGKAFKRKDTLFAHMRMHTGERRHMCHECGMTFKERSHLKVHQSTHAGIKNSICEVCGKRFLNQTNLTCHMRSHMSKTHKCTQCTKVFRLEKQLDLHVRIVHMGEHVFKCSFEECKDIPGYTAQCNLNKHYKLRHANSLVIEPGKPFRCTLCPLSFSKQNYLDKHMKTHTKDKSNNVDRLDCNICGKVLASRDGLKHHYLRHGHLRTLDATYAKGHSAMSQS